jgi:hypothetical protein
MFLSIASIPFQAQEEGDRLSHSGCLRIAEGPVDSRPAPRILHYHSLHHLALLLFAPFTSTTDTRPTVTPDYSAKI